jgi:anti-sigma regulatory factor (Ser/Thr protein kinase)
MKDHLEILIGNQPSEIGRVLEALENFGAEHGISPRHIHELDLALEEHLTNIITHAFQTPAEHEIVVRGELTGHTLRLEIADDGRPFNPLEFPEPDLTAPLEERPIGGLGIHMMRKSVDAMEYRRENGKNVLALVKRI